MLIGMKQREVDIQNRGLIMCQINKYPAHRIINNNGYSILKWIFLSMDQAQLCLILILMPKLVLDL